MEKEIFNTIGILDWDPNIWKLIVRLVLAAIAGFAIGFERKYRLKDAGVKTHTIMCITSCLLMIISKYGFGELLGIEGANYDVARVASTIATGLCFIGSGMLLYKNDNIKGLTTACGMCLTMAVGMCFGAGLIIIGFFVTLFSIFIQIVLHLPIFKNKDELTVKAQFIVGENNINEYKEKFGIKQFINFKTYTKDGKLIAEAEFVFNDRKIKSENLIKTMKEDKNILMLEIHDEDK